MSHSNPRVNYKKNKIRSSCRFFHLTTDLGIQLRTAWHPTAGINNAKFFANPFDISFESVTGDTRLIFDNCYLSTQKPVEQSALANIWSSDDYNGRQSFSHACILQAVYARTMSTKVCA
jgi:hypothetical protein